MRAGYVTITGVLDNVGYFGVWIRLIEMVQRQEEKKACGRQ